MRAKGEKPWVVHPPRLKAAGKSQLPSASRKPPRATEVPLPKLLGQLQRALKRDDREQARRLERAIDQAVLGYPWSPAAAAAADSSAG